MKFQRFLDGFDSSGGHIFILATGALVGVAMLKYQIAEGRTVLVGAGGALLALLRNRAA